MLYNIGQVFYNRICLNGMEVNKWEKWSRHLAGQFKQLLHFYRHLKNSGGSNGIWSHHLCDASPMLYKRYRMQVSKL